MSKGHDAYHMRLDGLHWPVIAEQIGYTGYRMGDRAHNIAKRWAQTRGLPWPPETDTQSAATCEGKKRHANHSAAKKAIQPRLKKFVDVYRCPICGGFHIGSIDRNRRLAGKKR